MNSPHILLVDDDVLTLQVLKDHLQFEGYRVSLADGCREAMKTLRGSEKIDALILDYLLPDGTGTDLLRSMALEEKLQKPQVIISSSIITQNDPSWDHLRQRLPALSQSLIQAYVAKPYAFDDMDTVLRRLFQVSHPRSSPAHEISSGDYAAAPALLKIR